MMEHNEWTGNGRDDYESDDLDISEVFTDPSTSEEEEIEKKNKRIREENNAREAKSKCACVSNTSVLCTANARCFASYRNKK